jgi:hypothetical protein
MVSACRTRYSAAMTQNAPDFELETALIAQGYRFVAGVDEVGRGPLAGPVTACALTQIIFRPALMTVKNCPKPNGLCFITTYLPVQM